MIPTLNDFKKQLSEAILKSLKVEEKSFAEYGVKVSDFRVRLENLEFTSPKVWCTVHVDNFRDIYGFSLQFVLQDDQKKVIDVVDTFVDTRSSMGEGKEVHYPEVFLPDDLSHVKSIVVSPTKVILPEQTMETK